jgi:F-type H+/Na+-transporting ATPase subunit beta
MQESGVLPQTCLVFGQMNEPPGARLRVGLTALTMAEYFRDIAGQDVLLFVDNIFRFTQAGSEVSALAGPHALRRRLPAHAGHGDGRVAGAHHLDAEGLDHVRAGCLRARRRLYRPGPDAHLDASTTFARSVRAGDLPGGGPAGLGLAHAGANADCGRRHYRVARGVQEILQRYKDLRDIIAILGIDELGEDDKLVVGRARRIQQFLTQPMFVAEVFTSIPGEYVTLVKETVRGFKEILEGKHDDLPEQAFYLVGNIDQARSRFSQDVRRSRPRTAPCHWRRFFPGC